MKNYNTMTEFKNKNKSEGYHFFDDDTMEFFNSKIETSLFSDDTFITSEQGPHHNSKKYTIRKALADGSVETVSEFCEFDSLKEARQARK